MSNLSLTQCKVRLIKLFLGSNSGWPNPLTVLFELLLKVLLTPIFSLLILWNNIHQMPQKYQNVFFKKHCNSKWSFSLLTICFPFQRRPSMVAPPHFISFAPLARSIFLRSLYFLLAGFSSNAVKSSTVTSIKTWIYTRLNLGFLIVYLRFMDLC